MSSTTRKRISIYDYPEHLNPFSECHLNVPDKRTIFVDKFRKNGTWSSKITKRLNRSVSWIEKSWLQVDNSPRRAYESRICNDLHNNALYTKQSQVHNVPITRRESCSDVRHETETPPEYSIINGNAFEKSKSVENLNKCDTRRRKKRPAPLPPSAIRSLSMTENRIDEDLDQEKVSKDECEMEENSRCENAILHEDETNTEMHLREIESSDEVPCEENSSQNASCCEEPSNQMDEMKLNEQIENMQIEASANEKEQSKLSTSSEHEASENESDEKRKEIVEVQLDENANISSLKNENEKCDTPNNQIPHSLVADNEILKV